MDREPSTVRPTLEEQMQAQAELRGQGKTKESQIAIGCLAWVGLILLSLMLGAAVIGGLIAFWSWVL